MRVVVSRHALRPAWHGLWQNEAWEMNSEGGENEGGKKGARHILEAVEGELKVPRKMNIANRMLNLGPLETLGRFFR